MKPSSLYTTILLARLGAATPVTSSASQAQVERAATVAHDVDRALLLLNDCKGQSCDIAHASGSTGIQPTLMPEGSNDEDVKCILKYNPSLAALLQQPNVPKVPKQAVGVSTDLFKWLSGLQRPNERKNGETDKGNFTAKCAPNILIFSKGTLEPTQYGITVGPALTSGWDKKTWVTAPVIYDPTVSGDFCLALPGGMVAKDMINQAAVKCPSSKIYLAGYSQGAMVVRNGIAYANDSAKSHVKGVITFGDPFQGAPIKGYNGPIKTFCKVDDGVCTGNFELAGAHLSYPFDNSVTEAKAVLKKWAAAS
jgi:hypothetical protein